MSPSSNRRMERDVSHQPTRETEDEKSIPVDLQIAETSIENEANLFLLMSGPCRSSARAVFDPNPEPLDTPRKTAWDPGTPRNSLASRDKGDRPRTTEDGKNTGRSEPPEVQPLGSNECSPQPARRDTRKTLCNRTVDTRPGDLQRQLTSISWARGVVRLHEA